MSPLRKSPVKVGSIKISVQLVCFRLRFISQAHIWKPDSTMVILQRKRNTSQNCLLGSKKIFLSMFTISTE